MRFALIDDQRTEAQPGLKGLCPGCSQPVIAKCGTQRSHHWAHRDDKQCDYWREPETEWHRSWKNNFPIDWQEIILPDEQTGEKHIADLCTDYGLVVEFQYSHIQPDERTSRENFYQNMAWVVDGTRRLQDYPRFSKRKTNFRQTNLPGIFLVGDLNECFHSSWLRCSVPVIFDFKGSESLTDSNHERNQLYCLFPDRMIGRYSAIVAVISREFFVENIINGDWLILVSNYSKYLLTQRQQQEQLGALEQRIQDKLAFDQFTRAARYKFSRPVRYKRRRF